MSIQGHMAYFSHNRRHAITGQGNLRPSLIQLNISNEQKGINTQCEDTAT